MKIKYLKITFLKSRTKIRNWNWTSYHARTSYSYLMYEDEVKNRGDTRYEKIEEMILFKIKLKRKQSSKFNIRVKNWKKLNIHTIWRSTLVDMIVFKF